MNRKHRTKHLTFVVWLGQKIEKSIRRGAGSRASKQARGGGIATLCQRQTTNLLALTQALTYSFFHLLALCCGLTFGLVCHVYTPTNAHAQLLKTRFPALLQQLQAKDATQREFAVRTIGYFRKRALALLPKVFPLLNDKAPQVRTSALRSIGQICHTLSTQQHTALTAKTQDSDWKVRATAIWALGRCTQQETKLLPLFLKGLQDPQHWVRQRALEAIGNFGVKAKQTLPSVSQSLHDKHWLVRMQAVKTLARISHYAKDIAPSLFSMLSDTEPAVRLLVSKQLEKMPKEIIPELGKSLDNNDPHVRKMAIYVLGKKGSQHKEAIVYLRKALKDKDLSLREIAATELGNLREKARTALPELEHNLYNKRHSLKQIAAWALGRIGTVSLPVLMKAVRLHGIKPKDWRIKVAAIEALIYLGPKAAPAAPALVEAMLNHHWRVRKEAAWAILRIGPGVVKYLDKPYVKMLTKAHHDRIWPIKLATVKALGWMGPVAKSSLWVMRRMRFHPNAKVRQAANSALISIKRR